MTRTNYKELLDAGVHFGHLKRKWNPNMAPYIFMERNGIHIIDINKTVAKIEDASSALKQIAKSGKKILFVGTKKQAKDVVANYVKKVNMPYVTERWPGGMLTNFVTIRKAVKKMSSIDKMAVDGTFTNLSKRERLQVTRQRAKLEKNLGSIVDLTRLPAAVFVVDIIKEDIAVAEAKKLSIPTFGIVDTNSDPNKIDFPIPGNDDAAKSIEAIVKALTEAVQEGLDERKIDKEKQIEEERIKKEAKVEEDDDEIKMKEKRISTMISEEEDEDVIKGKHKISPAKKEALKIKGTPRKDDDFHRDKPRRFQKKK
ncbi:MAG: 30S ribosomal protein S2 [Bacteroidales bacterium]|jgi:small subunit ribosomal protein S2